MSSVYLDSRHQNQPVSCTQTSSLSPLTTTWPHFWCLRVIDVEESVLFHGNSCERRLSSHISDSFLVLSQPQEAGGDCGAPDSVQTQVPSDAGSTPRLRLSHIPVTVALGHPTGFRGLEGTACPLSAQLAEFPERRQVVWKRAWWCLGFTIMAGNQLVLTTVPCGWNTILMDSLLYICILPEI